MPAIGLHQPLTSQASASDEMVPHESNGFVSWLARPLSGSWCVFGWFAATVMFVGLLRLVGGPTESDLAQSAYGTWLIAHGHFACAYSPQSAFHFPSVASPFAGIAPLWPLLSGGVAALLHVGSNVPFPSQGALGPHCSTALVSTYKWSVQSSAASTTAQLGYLGWLVLMSGTVALLRAVGRGRCGWEPATLLMLACVPSVGMTLTQYFHPQDLVAMGLILGCLACIKRERWVWGGVLIGMAITSQQFSLLVFLSLAVLAGVQHRVKFVTAAIAAAAVVIVPLAIVTSGRAVKAELIGSGNSASFGGTVLWEIHLHGVLLVAASRILPLLLSMAVAWWSLRRLGPLALEPVPLVAVIATSLALRLVFEQNLFGYYLMALAVSLLLLEVASGRIRGQLVAWLALSTLVFSPVPWGFFPNGLAWGVQEREFLPFVFMAAGLFLVVRDAIHGRIRAYLVAWLVVTILAFARIPWTNPAIRHALPVWVWQVVLVSTGVALAVSPLIAAIRDSAGNSPLLIEEHPYATTHA